MRGKREKGKGKIERRPEKRAFSSAGYHVAVPVVVCVAAVDFFL
jgi:hypothetical protein